MAAAEDSRNVLQKVPGAIANLSTRPDTSAAFPNHSPAMLVNESAARQRHRDARGGGAALFRERGGQRLASEAG